MADDWNDPRITLSRSTLGALMLFAALMGAFAAIQLLILFPRRPIEIEQSVQLDAFGPLTLEPAPPKIVIAPWFEEPLHELYEPDGSIVYHSCPLEMRCPDIFEGIERLDNMPLRIVRDFSMCRSWAMYDSRTPGLATAPPPTDASEEDWRKYCLDLAFFYDPFAWI